MKPKINLLGCCIGIILVIGLTGCGEDAVEEDPVEFVQAIPATGSEIQPDATIIASFDGTPTGVQVTGAKFSVSGANVTITGPFTAGALSLVITWSDGAATLTYKVAEEKVQVVTRYDGDSIYFKRDGTFFEGRVVEGVSPDEVLVALADGGEKVIYVDHIGGTLIANHPDLGVRVKLLGDPDKGETTLSCKIIAAYSDGMRKIEVLRVNFRDGESEWPDVPPIRFVHVNTDFEDGGYLTLDEFLVWLELN